MTPLVLRLAQVVVLACLATMMSGIERYFAFWSPTLHYGFDAIAAAAAAVCLLSLRQGRAFMRSVCPGLAFVLLYLAWGLVVSPTRDDVQQAATSAMVLAALTMALVSVSFHDRSSLARVASVACVVSVVTFAMMVYELGSPSLVAQIAAARGSILDYTGRPSGFWPNPNDAGIVLVVALVLSTWSRHAWLAWPGRVTAILGVYLSGSREAFYWLAVVIVVMVVWRAVVANPRTGRRLQPRLIASGLAIAVAVAIGLAAVAQLGGGEVLQSSLGRILDFSQSQNNLTYNPSRLYLFELWWPVALHNPWYGGGIFSFQGNGTIEVLGAHDLYLTVFGEDGLPMLGLYVALLGFTLWQVLQVVPSKHDRLPLGLLYGFWIFEGLVDHTQFSDPSFLIFFALLLRIPLALGTATSPQEVMQVSSAAARPPAPAASQEAPVPVRRQDRSGMLPSGDVHPWSPITDVPW